MRSSYPIIPIIKKINNKRCKTRKIYKTYKKRKTYKTYKTRIKYFGGTLNIMKRLIRERTQLEIPLGENIQYNYGSYIYTIDTSQLETNHTFTITRHIDDSKVTIKIPENYPFDAPTIISDLVTTHRTHEILIPNWTPANNIFKSIFEMLQPASDTSDEQKKYKMLIYCHPAPGHDISVYKKKAHYFYDHLATFIEMHYSETTIADFDIKTLDSNIIGNPDIKVDGFSKTFIANHPDRYDIITLPDCAGIWNTYQLQGYTDIPAGEEEQQALVFNIINIFNLLNINGYMILSKFININFFYKLSKYFSSEETKYKIIQPIITDTSIKTILIVQKLV